MKNFEKKEKHTNERNSKVGDQELKKFMGHRNLECMKTENWKMYNTAYYLDLGTQEDSLLGLQNHSPCCSPPSDLPTNQGDHVAVTKVPTDPIVFPPVLGQATRYLLHQELPLNDQHVIL